MNDSEDRRGLPGKPASAPRQERLKQALRENLRRRKSQARQRDDVARASDMSGDVIGSDGEGRPDK